MSHDHRRRFLARVGFLILILQVAVSVAAVAADPPQERWVHIWNGSADLSDYGLLVALDPAGPVFVAGTTYEGGVGGNQDDIILLKLGERGDLIWSRRHGGEGTEQPSGLVVSSSGRIGVTGYSLNGTQSLVTTIAFDEDGMTLWSHGYPLGGA